jgi:hypothetical protein
LPAKWASYVCLLACWNVAIYWFLFLCRGSKIFPSFVAFLKSDSPTDGTEDALLAELEALDKALGEGEVSGPS